MNDFIPTDDFVIRVMSEVHAYEKIKCLEQKRVDHSLSKPVFYALSVGGIVLGIVNFLRIMFTFISPTLCR
jgi:hypothetical protein